MDLSIAHDRLGYDPYTVLDMVDSGALLWVWDVSLKRGAGRPQAGGRRELRFWVSELLSPAMNRHWTIDAVVRAVVGHETCEELRAPTICWILQIRPPQLWHLINAGEITGRMGGRARWIERSSLVEFLRRRWVGATLDALIPPAMAATPHISHA